MFDVKFVFVWNRRLRSLLSFVRIELYGVHEIKDLFRDMRPDEMPYI